MSADGIPAAQAESLRSKTTYGHSNSPLFNELPAELRNQIFVEAFGLREIHLRIVQESPFQWRWACLECVEHPRLPGMECMLRTHIECKREEEGSWWSGLAVLLSCRQAYREGIEVLYSTNSFITDSTHLIHNVSDALPLHYLHYIRTFEIMCDIFEVVIADLPGETGDQTDQQEQQPEGLQLLPANMIASALPGLRTLFLSYRDDEGKLVNILRLFNDGEGDEVDDEDENWAQDQTTGEEGGATEEMETPDVLKTLLVLPVDQLVETHTSLVDCFIGLPPHIWDAMAMRKVWDTSEDNDEEDARKDEETNFGPFTLPIPPKRVLHRRNVDTSQDTQLQHASEGIGRMSLTEPKSQTGANGEPGIRYTSNRPGAAYWIFKAPPIGMIAKDMRDHFNTLMSGSTWFAETIEHAFPGPDRWPRNSIAWEEGMEERRLVMKKIKAQYVS